MSRDISENYEMSFKDAQGYDVGMSDQSCNLRGKKIVLTTFGSLGDLHPFIALGIELKRRGHRPVIATHEPYREKIEGEGIAFAPVRPDLAAAEERPEFMRKVMDLRRGPEFVVREIVMPNLRASYEDILAAAEGADLLVTHTLTFVSPVIAEKMGIPWAAVALSPLVFFSALDPSVLAPMPHLNRLRVLGPGVYAALLRAGQKSVRSWSEPVRELRRELGLRKPAADPLFTGQFSPHLNLALFSHVFGEPQKDWPAKTVICGFAFHDRQGAGSGLPEELESYLSEGEPPIVFTLGSAAVMDAGLFFVESAKAAASLGRRAVLLIGRDPRNRLNSLPAGVQAFEYAPFSELFPRAAVNVHQGGVGTTGQALRAGKPMLVMPYSHDQPDNAYRIQRLGVGRAIPRVKYNAKSAAREINRLLTDRSCAERAAEVGREVRKEDGAATACDALESLLN